MVIFLDQPPSSWVHTCMSYFVDLYIIAEGRFGPQVIIPGCRALNIYEHNHFYFYSIKKILLEIKVPSGTVVVTHSD